MSVTFATPAPIRAFAARIDLLRVYGYAMSLSFFGSGVAAVLMAQAHSHGTDEFMLLGLPMNIHHGGSHMLLGGIGFAALAAHRELEYAKFMATVLAFLFLCGNLPQPAFGFLPVGGSDMFLHGAAASLGAYAIAKRPSPPDESAGVKEMAMASLVAIEHTRLLLESSSPKVRDRLPDAETAARLAAESRLAALRSPQPDLVLDLDGAPTRQ